MFTSSTVVVCVYMCVCVGVYVWMSVCVGGRGGGQRWCVMSGVCVCAYNIWGWGVGWG